MELLGKKLKKLVHIGGGAGVILTKEASLMKWKTGDYLSVERYSNGTVVLKKIEY